MLQGITAWIATLSGLVATAAAVTVLATLPADDTHESEPSTTTGGATAQASAAGSDAVVWAPSEPIEGIDPAVSDALVASGYTEFMTTSELEQQLPASVVNVLDRAGAVLVIPNQGSGNAR